MRVHLCMAYCMTMRGAHAIVFGSRSRPAADMFSRNSQPSSSSHGRPDDDFVADVRDLQAENLVSAQRATTLLRKAACAGVNVPPKIKQGRGHNMARQQLRQALKRTKWPEYYWFQCRVVRRKTKTNFSASLCMMLPQEILEMIWELGSEDVLLDTQAMDSESQAHLQWMKGELQALQLWGFGLHGDGVPCNYDRTESVVVISLNLPGLPGRNGRLRIPIISLPDWCIGPHTFDDIMAVIAWSMRHLLVAERPTCRHDGEPWLHSDKKRSKSSKSSLPIPACMCQARGDWDWMGKCFHLPFHGVIAGNCWLCTNRRDEVVPHCMHVCALLHYSLRLRATISIEHSRAPLDFELEELRYFRGHPSTANCDCVCACLLAPARSAKQTTTADGELRDCRLRSCLSESLHVESMYRRSSVCLESRIHCLKWIGCMRWTREWGRISWETCSNTWCSTRS